MNHPKIISITYSMYLGEEIHLKCCAANVWGNKRYLDDKLTDIPEISTVLNHSFDKIEITFKTDSIKKVDPKFNIKLWQKIADIITEHITYKE